MYERGHRDLLCIVVVLSVIFIHVIQYFVLSSLSEGCKILYVKQRVLEGSCTAHFVTKQPEFIS